jgi:hypothetical protein
MLFSKNIDVVAVRPSNKVSPLSWLICFVFGKKGRERE